MRADIKRFRRRNEAIESSKRHLEVERIKASHNLAMTKLKIALLHVRRPIKWQTLLWAKRILNQ